MLPKIPDSLFSSGRTLSIHMWALSSEGFHTDAAYATAVILLILVFKYECIISLCNQVTLERKTNIMKIKVEKFRFMVWRLSSAP